MLLGWKRGEPCLAMHKGLMARGRGGAPAAGELRRRPFSQRGCLVLVQPMGAGIHSASKPQLMQPQARGLNDTKQSKAKQI
eukprot:1162128-Pelagomonas_calceolata.AAC.13